MAFHVACPITCQRICFCKLGFPQKIQSDEAKNGFLEDIFRVEEFLRDPLLINSKQITTVQVVVPKVVRPPPPPSARSNVDGFGSGGDGYDASNAVVGGDGSELLSLQAKRIELQKKAVAASIAAEDYARKFETGSLELLDNAGETLRDIVGEDRSAKVMCRICFDGENEGSERANKMLPCKLCNKKYHRSCLKTWGHDRDLFHLNSWICPSCRTCEVCRVTGDPTKFMFCKRCDGAYHCYCRPNQHKNVSTGPYLCPKHTRCHSCGSNVPGNGPSTRWFLGYTCCDACGRLFVKGNYCPVCLKVYRDSEPTPMVCCDVCERWVHKDCDGISDEKYQEFQADGNLYYKCAACRGDCYQVKGLDDAVQELWRRRDKADRDQIASLRASAGLSSEEFPALVFTDDEGASPTTLKKESGRSLKFSVKGSAQKGAKSNKSSTKKSGNKKVYQVPSIDKSSAPQSYELNDRRSTEFTLNDDKDDDMHLYKSKGTDMFSSPNAKSPSNAKEKCSINQAGFMKEDFIQEVVSNNEARAPKIAQVKTSKSHGPSLGFGFEKHTTKVENVKGKKLVIHLGARNRNVNNSPRSEASSCHREQDITASNGSEDTSQLKLNKKHAVEKKDGAARFYDVKGEKSAKTELLKYSRGQEGSLMKLGKNKSEVSNLNSQSSKGNIIDESTAVGKPRVLLARSKEGSAAASEHPAGASLLKTEEVPLRRHTKGVSAIHNETRENNTQKPPPTDSLPKDPKPLLKLKFKNPYVDNRSSWVPQEEEKSSNKRQRSKRKRPEKNQVREEGEEEEEEEAEEGNTQVHQESPVKEAMDANWILKKLGKDAIGKRVEVHQPSDSSWHKGEVTDMVGGTSTLVVLLDDGRARTLELGKQAIRFVSQKQKRSKT